MINPQFAHGNGIWHSFISKLTDSDNLANTVNGCDTIGHFGKFFLTVIKKTCM